MPSEELIKVESVIEHGIGYVRVEGRLMAESRFALERVLRGWAEEGDLRHVLISCRNLEYIDSAGLSTLIGAFHRLKRLGGELVLCEINPALESLFEITAIRNFFSVFDSIDEAARHLGKAVAEIRKKTRGKRGKPQPQLKRPMQRAIKRTIKKKSPARKLKKAAEPAAKKTARKKKLATKTAKKSIKKARKKKGAKNAPTKRVKKAARKPIKKAAKAKTKAKTAKKAKKSARRSARAKTRR